MGRAPWRCAGIAALAVVTVAVGAAAAPAAGPARGVVLVIGDGMGLGQVTAASLARGPLSLESAPVTGLVRTFAAGALVTDSAAAATAMACGVRTRPGVVGLAPDGTRLGSVFEAARDAGLAVGVVTTSGLADATPAGFLAHAASRRDYAAILRQELAFGAAVLIGGDFTAYPRARTSRGYLDVVAHAAELVPPGTAVVRDLDALPPPGRPVVALLPPRAAHPEQHGPPLARMALAALERIASDPEGFVLLVESEATDEAGHASDGAYLAEAAAELDRAVRALVQRATELGGVTVVVTADHDTGGLAPTGGSPGGEAALEWLTRRHTALWVPLFAWGDGAPAFAGVLDNTDLGRRIASLLGLPGA